MIVKLIGTSVEAAMRDNRAIQAFSESMSPTEFEAFCAEELRRVGWNSRVTRQSRDQGVDVVAEKGNVRVVLQCKLYSRPVGNKAVQEAAAAKAHEQAHHGVVVTNNRYTSDAEQLANTNGILLLHFSDLRNLDSLLNAVSTRRGLQS
jgi:HJR/Mrr/RecB family endonuclease